MKSLLVRTLVRPLLERLGALATGVLIAKGWDAGLVEQLVVALSAVGLLSFDLIVARVHRESEE